MSGVAEADRNCTEWARSSRERENPAHSPLDFFYNEKKKKKKKKREKIKGNSSGGLQVTWLSKKFFARCVI